MTRLQIDLPDDVRRLADEQVATGQFASLSEYLSALIREDRSRTGDESLHEVLRQRVRSGPPDEMNDSDFDRIRGRLESEITRRGGS